MGFFDSLPQAPKLRPHLNVGSVFDIPTGNYVLGQHGESILNAGVSTVNSIAGPGNTFKSEILNYLFFTVMARYSPSQGAAYDTENSMTYKRLNRAANRHWQLKDVDFSSAEGANKLRLTQSADILGDDYFELIKEGSRERAKASKKLEIGTPFFDDSGKQIAILPPMLVNIDSLTEFKVSAVQDKLVDKNAVGESGANTQFMKDGAAKTQLITQLPNMGVQGGLYFFLVAHIGMGIEMDPYAPKAPKLTHSRSGTKTKGVPEKFSFINNNLFEIFDAKVLYNSSADKSARYPKSDSDRIAGTSDLTVVHMVNTRNKNGPSGIKFELVISQSEGLLPHLTNFHFLKGQNYGFSGNNTTYVLDIYPEVTLSRTTIRSKIDEDPKLCRALEIVTQLRQMELYWSDIDPALHVTPDVLYKDIKELGYDWDILLDTRDYWVFECDESKEKPFLSTMDLLRMRAGQYVPWWYPKKT